MNDLALTRILLIRLASEARDRILMDRGRQSRGSKS